MGKVYRFERFVLDVSRGSLRANDREIALRPRTFELLQYFVQNSDRLIGKDELMKAVWPRVIVTDDSLKRCVSDVRAALSDESQRIVRTVSRRGYMFTPMVSADAGSAAGPGHARPIHAPGPSASETPSVAILPFANLSGDPAHDHLCDGLTEDIITELARFREFLVIGRNSSFRYKGQNHDLRAIGHELGARYVVEGSVQRERTRIRITAQLVDAESGAHRWAERYDRETEDVFSIQDELARTIAITLAMRLRKAEFERVNSKPRDTWRAYDYYMKGTECAIYYSLTLKSELIAEAQRLLEQSIAMDPSCGRAYARLAGIHVGRYVVWFDDGFLSRKTLEQAYQLGLTGVQLEPDLPLAHANLAHVLLYLNRDCLAALTSFERALSLNPNYQDSREVLILTSACEFERAIQAAQRMLRIDSLAGGVLIYSGLAHYMAKRYAEAYTQLRESIARSRNSRPSHLFLAATCARMGRLDEAHAEIAEVLRIVPGYTIDGMARRLTFFRDPEANEHYYDALRLAGLPEGEVARGDV